MNEFLKYFKINFIVSFITILLMFGFKLIPSFNYIGDLSKAFILSIGWSLLFSVYNYLDREYKKTKFTKMSKEEHDKTRIDVYDYIIK